MADTKEYIQHLGSITNTGLRVYCLAIHDNNLWVGCGDGLINIFDTKVSQLLKLFCRSIVRFLTNIVVNFAIQ
jgi:hypothetical protein